MVIARFTITVVGWLVGSVCSSCCAVVNVAVAIQTTIAIAATSVIIVWVCNNGGNILVKPSVEGMFAPR